MRSLLLIALLVLFQACGNDRELHTHEKEYEWLQEIETEKRAILNKHVANLAVRYAHKAGDPKTIAEAVVDASAIEINELVDAAGEVKTAERGGGLDRETEVDQYKESLRKNLRKTLYKNVVTIIENERAKKQPAEK